MTDPQVVDYPMHEVSRLRRRTIVAALIAFAALGATAISFAGQDASTLAATSATPTGAPAVAAPTAPTRSTPPGAPGEADASSPALRLREGTQLSNRMGHFKQNGEIVKFVDEEGRELGGLPNLNLERIVRMLKSVEEPESVSWSVSGTVTEFSGRNYLLISRAVYKAATAPPIPDRLGE